MSAGPAHLGAGVPPGAVVVALDGGRADLPALRWGGEQARATGRPLHVVHVLEVPGPACGAAQGTAGRPADEVADALTTARDRARRLAATARPAAGVGVMVGHRLQVLVALSRRAHLLVLGDGRGGERGAGAQHAFLAMRARCPVAVVPCPGTTPQDRGPAVPTARRRAVVVGVDGAHAAHGALDLAFAHAARSGCELRVVHVWPPRTPASRVHDPGWDERRRTVAEVLAGYRERHPGATVVTHLVRGDVVDALVSRAWNAELLVLSGCDGARRPGLMPGAVTLGVLARAACPVVMVRDGTLGGLVGAGAVVRDPVGAQR